MGGLHPCLSKSELDHMMLKFSNKIKVLVVVTTNHEGLIASGPN